MSSMNDALMVGIGAGIGGMLRHGVSVASARLLGPDFPYGTMTVNVVGSFVMGLLAAYFALKGEASQASRLFLTTGLLGGFTTFSAYSLETVLLYEQGRGAIALGYACGSVVISLGALFAGLTIMRSFM
jgi:fluoride exporter